MKLILISATRELLFFASWFPLNDKKSPVWQTHFWQIPRRSSIFVDTRIFETLAPTYFSTGCLLHNTNQSPQHSCGHGYVQHIQLQLGWASKALCLSSAKPANDTSEVCRYPVADGSLSPQWECMSVELLCCFVIKNSEIRDCGKL